MISSVCGHGQKGYSQVFVFSFCRFEVELVSTGEVKEYSASANYELQREGNDQIDTLKFAVQAEGKSQKKKTMWFCSVLSCHLPEKTFLLMNRNSILNSVR